MRTPLIAGNWKMHKTLPDARALVQAIRDGLPAATAGAKVDVLICPPAQLLFPMAKAVAGSPILLGAQNAHEEPQGAFTGEISVPMLMDTGCTHIIIGHSERRQLFGEGSERLAKKVRAVLSAGLTCVYCVGETLAERESGKTQDVLSKQCSEVLSRELNADRLVIAYEPVWAIGTGKTATPQQAQQAHAFLRSRLSGIFGAPVSERIRILYGGSVKPGNAVGLLGLEDVDGALVGGACLEAGDFLAIISASHAPARATA